MSVHDFSATDIDGREHTLDEYAGRVLLIVNVASKCGLTPQYEGLEALYRAVHPQGLEILGFPCNQFGGQEPGTAAEITAFCSTQYDVSFPLFGKIDVNGPDAHPLYAYLRTEAPGDFGPDYGRFFDVISSMRPEAVGTDEVKWNFTKFLVDGDGAVLRRYEPTVTPEEIRPDLEALLAGPAGPADAAEPASEAEVGAGATVWVTAAAEPAVGAAAEDDVVVRRDGDDVYIGRVRGARVGWLSEPIAVSLLDHETLDGLSAGPGLTRAAAQDRLLVAAEGLETALTHRGG